ncbi:MAG: folate family ECF transporter S component, partial [Clostridia bacterium]
HMDKNVPNRREITKRVTITAVFIALVGVSTFFSFTIPIFGMPGMSVTIGGIFTIFPAILFGPLYGGIASAASDFLGCIINPIGAYNPLYTISAFVGGVIKGYLWIWLRNKKTIHIRAVASVVAVLLLCGGIMFNVSLSNDKISTGFFQNSSELESKGKLQQKEKSFVSDFVVGLASYSNDSYTVSSVSDCEEFVVPATIECDGIKYTPKIGQNAFKNCPSLKRIYVPENIKSISEKAFDGAPNAVIYCTAGSAAEKIFKEHSRVETVEKVEKSVVKLEYGQRKYSVMGAEISATQTYAEALAKYITCLTAGFIGVSLLMLLLICGELAYSKFRKSTRNEPCGFKIFTSIFVSGFIVTTINTQILRYITYPSWSSRGFLILWIPRVAEELIVCMIQAYFIILLYDVYRNKIEKKLN